MMAGSARESLVDTASGRLRGAHDGTVHRFRGVPYAAPSGGSARFQAPRPVTPWAGVRDALRCGDRCPQEREAYGDPPVLAWYAQTEPFSEDCGVLNVFTPGLDGAKRPVMVYIHGGGYNTGGGGGEVLDGGRLAAFGDVVVVTLNHRLNVFGYLNLGHLDATHFGDAANAGHLDLVAALRWVRENIAAFGGDPGCVTLFGQSGGGSKIMVLMGMPAAQGLFHRAINMSGASGLTVVPAAATEPYVGAFLQHLGVGGHDLRRLQALPAQALLEARAAAVAACREGSRPVIDGRHVLAEPMSPQGLAVHASVPLLMGMTGTEATFYFAGDARHLQLSAAQVKARLRAQFSIDDAQAEALMDAFRQDGPTRTPSDILIALISDTLFRIPMLRGAAAKAAAQQAPVYVYNFIWNAPVEGGRWGSPHAMDIPFAFGTTDHAAALAGSGPEAAAVSRQLMASFVAFARSGNPGHAGLPAWQPYDAATKTSMCFDTECRAAENFRGADLAAGSALRLDPFNRQALLTYKD